MNFARATRDRSEGIGLADQPRQFQQRVRARLAPVCRAVVGGARLIPKIAAALIGHTRLRARLSLTSGAVEVEDAISHFAIVTSSGVSVKLREAFP
jgi:hypothetical protein